MPLSSFPCAYSQYIALCNSIAMWNPFQAGVQLATICCVYFAAWQSYNTALWKKKVSVPIEWLIVCGFCLYITAAYPAQGISVQGQQVFLRTSRGKWWLSKCIWCIASCTLYFACEMIAIIGTAILTPVTFGLNNTPGNHRILVFGCLVWRDNFTHAGKCYPIRFAPSVCDAYGRMYAANTLKPLGPSGHQLSNMLCHIYCCRIFPH